MYDQDTVHIHAGVLPYMQKMTTIYMQPLHTGTHYGTYTGHIYAQTTWQPTVFAFVCVIRGCVGVHV